MDAIEQRQAVFSRKARHTFVRRQHEILDHHLRLAALTGDDFHRLAVFIQHKARFLDFKINAALRLPARAQFPGQNAHLVKRVRHGGHRVRLLLASVKQRVHIVVHQPRLAARDGSGDALVHHTPRVVDFHQRGHREFILVRPQRTNAVAELLRQHRQHAPRQIDARAARKRFAIQRRSRPDVVPDVRDMHAEAHMAVFKLLKAHRVVEVLCIAPVNGERQQMAQILARRVVRQIRRAAGVRLLQHILRKIGAQAHAHHQCVERIGRLLKAADAFLDADAQAAFILPAGDMGADNFAVLGFGMQVGDGNFSRESALERLNHAHTVVHPQHTHDVFMRMRQHLGDNHAVAADAFRQNRIAKERSARVFFRAGVNRSVLGLHADCAASHAANGQLHRLFLLCALGAHIPRGALRASARPAV